MDSNPFVPLAGRALWRPLHRVFEIRTCIHTDHTFQRQKRQSFFFCNRIFHFGVWRRPGFLQGFHPYDPAGAFCPRPHLAGAHMRLREASGSKTQCKKSFSGRKAARPEKGCVRTCRCAGRCSKERPWKPGIRCNMRNPKRMWKHWGEAFKTLRAKGMQKGLYKWVYRPAP